MFLKENIKLVDNISLLEDIINFNEEYYNIKNDIILEEYKILVEGETFDKLKEKAKNLYTIIVNFLKRMWEKLKQVYYTIKNKIFGGWDSIIEKVNREKEDSMFEVFNGENLSVGMFDIIVNSGDYSGITKLGTTQKDKTNFIKTLTDYKNYFKNTIEEYQNKTNTTITSIKQEIESNKDNYEILDTKKIELSKYMLESQKQITNIMKLNSLLISKVSKYKIIVQVRDLEKYYGDIPESEREKRGAEAYLKGIRGEQMPNYDNDHEKYSYHSGKAARKYAYENFDNPEDNIKDTIEAKYGGKYI
jgi:hypothetical protein